MGSLLLVLWLVGAGVFLLAILVRSERRALRWEKADAQRAKCDADRELSVERDEA